MKFQILKDDPVVDCIAETSINEDSGSSLIEWVRDRHPECGLDEQSTIHSLFPRPVLFSNDSFNELIAELAGRTCYASFANKAGRKTNEEYLNHAIGGKIKHLSIAYHAKMTFFIAGISRRLSHELIRHYVGADRTEECSPSQESTRFVEHHGAFVMPPKFIGDMDLEQKFTRDVESGYYKYLDMVNFLTESYKSLHGVDPKGLERKRIFEACSGILPQQAETSFVLTFNPVSLSKLIRERSDESADLEFRRLAGVLKKISIERWPNLMKPLLGEV